jgi:hypothetical protein
MANANVYMILKTINQSKTDCTSLVLINPISFLCFGIFYFCPEKLYVHYWYKITVLGGTSLILVLSVNCHYLTWLASFLMHVAGMLDF